MIDELLTSKDIESRIFKKASFGGYVTSDVDEFLDQVCEDVDIYVARIRDFEHRVEQLEIKLKEYEEVKDSLQDTLFAAQRTAKQIISDSQRSVAENEAEAINIITAAREEAQKIIHESEDLLRKSQQESEEIIRQSHVERDRIIQEADFDARDIRNSIVKMKRERIEFLETSEAIVMEYQMLLKKSRENESN